MEGQVGQLPPELLDQPYIAYDQGVRPGPVQKPGIGHGLGQLPVRKQGIHGEKRLSPVKVAQVQGLFHFGVGKICSPPPGVEGRAAEVYAVRAAFEGRQQAFGAAGRG